MYSCNIISDHAIKLAGLEVENTSPTSILIIAGGYDSKNMENIEHYEELVELVKTLGLEKLVRFVRSPSTVHFIL